MCVLDRRAGTSRRCCRRTHTIEAVLYKLKQVAKVRKSGPPIWHNVSWPQASLRTANRTSIRLAVFAGRRRTALQDRICIRLHLTLSMRPKMLLWLKERNIIMRKTSNSSNSAQSKQNNLYIGFNSAQAKSCLFCWSNVIIYFIVEAQISAQAGRIFVILVSFDQVLLRFWFTVQTSDKPAP